MLSFSLIFDQAIQGSDEWLVARAGYLTGTGAAAVLPMSMLTDSKGKKDNDTTRKKYLTQLAAERLVGGPVKTHYSNGSMEHGTQHEPAAKWAYGERTGRGVREVGFARTSEMFVGCSLDGIAEGDETKVVGIVEVKCPDTDTHLGYRECGGVPSAYLRQVLHNLWVTGADWCDFVSYDPRLRGRLQLHVHRMERESVLPLLEIYEREALRFLDEVAAKVVELREQE